MNTDSLGRLARRLWPLVKFCMVGVVNTALSYGIYLALQTFLPYLVAHVTSFTTLLPGDVILTGTPAGVATIVPGDEVAITVAGIGTLANPVIGPED